MLRIEELREAKGLTLRDLDQATGISEQNIWRYAKGKQSPSIERAFLLARALGTTLDDLYVHEDDATDPAEGRKQAETTRATVTAGKR